MLRWKEVGEKSLEIKQIKNAIRRLEEKNYILTKKEGDRLFIKLLDNGVEEALKKLIIEKKSHLSKGEFCYVSFDIPEASRRVRLVLRTLLKRANFKMIHQSLWFTSRDIAQELSALVSLLKMKSWVHVIQGLSLTTQNISSTKKVYRRLKKKKEKLRLLKKERERVRRIASDLSEQ
ncbi:hypothetical protein HY771_03110 [Candidatus Uhrbacteria bacterium]|nr:hypothetical protein [Candidatus Uhrbacteria bacterium]